MAQFGGSRAHTPGSEEVWIVRLAIVRVAFWLTAVEMSVRNAPHVWWRAAFVEH